MSFTDIPEWMIVIWNISYMFSQEFPGLDRVKVCPSRRTKNYLKNKHQRSFWNDKEWQDVYGTHFWVIVRRAFWGSLKSMPTCSGHWANKLNLLFRKMCSWQWDHAIVGSPGLQYFREGWHRNALQFCGLSFFWLMALSMILIRKSLNMEKKVGQFFSLAGMVPLFLTTW